MAAATANSGGGGGGGGMIEVEKKYAPPEDICERVLRCGGQVKKDVTFSDAYWDFVDGGREDPPPFLTSRDCWLRKRTLDGAGDGGGAWELKVPVPGAEGRTGGELNTFREVVGAPAVASELVGLIGWSSSGGMADADVDFERSLAAFGLAPFAEFGTRRTKLAMPVTLPGGKQMHASIDVDQASFGHAVMEIELLCDEADQVPAMEVAIDSIADSLDLTPLTSAQGGKLETFIRTLRPHVFARLVECGILKD